MKVKILPLLLSSLTLLSPAGHASAAPGISVGFSPEGSAEALVLGVIDRAQADIRLAGYSFTSPNVSAALVRAKALETGSVNYTRAGARYNSENALVIEGMPVLADHYLQHWQSRWDAGTDYRLPY